jgi:RNA polymerase sigma factor (sigma-70 family)
LQAPNTVVTSEAHSTRPLTGSPPSRDAELIARILGGEREAFHELVQPYEKSVYFAAFSVLQNEQDAEDVAQETVLKALKALHSFRAESKFSTWLVSIAINEARARLRHVRVLQFESVDQAPQEDGTGFTPAVITDWREVPLASVGAQGAARAAPESYGESAGDIPRGAAHARCPGIQHRRDGGGAGRERRRREDQTASRPPDDAENTCAAIGVEAQWPVWAIQG